MDSKKGSVQWICLGNEVVFELGSSRFKVCLRRRLKKGINFMVLFFITFLRGGTVERIARAKAIGQVNEERGTGSTSGMRASKSSFVVQVTVFIRDRSDAYHI